MSRYLVTSAHTFAPPVPLGFKVDERGQPWWLSSLVPPSAQGVILETPDRVPHWASCMEPVSPPLSLSLSVSLMNK